MAGIESFQQSGLKISRPNFRILRKMGTQREPAAWGRSREVSMRAYAMANEMAPFMISWRRTAVAAEYAREGAVETRE